MSKKIRSLESADMPTKEGIVLAARELIEILCDEKLPEEARWTYVDMERAQRNSGYGDEQLCSAQSLRAFRLGRKTNDQPVDFTKYIPEANRLEALLDTFNCKAAVFIPDLSEIGTPEEFLSRLKKK